MIEVVITKVTPEGEREEMGYVRIENVGMLEGATLGDYSVRFSVERAGAVGLHQRLLRAFPRTRYNVLALVLQALHTLDPSELELESDTGPADLQRRQPGKVLRRLL